jgi:WXG100 family type VII secretion target
MNGIIKVETSKLTSTANQFNATGNNIKSITSNMTSIVNSLSGAIWTGNASTAYKKKFNDLQDDINRIIKMVNEHVEDLNQMAKEYDAAEQTNISVANSLSGDVIV